MLASCDVHLCKGSISGEGTLFSTIWFISDIWATERLAPLNLWNHFQFIIVQMIHVSCSLEFDLMQQCNRMSARRWTALNWISFRVIGWHWVCLCGQASYQPISLQMSKTNPKMDGSSRAAAGLQLNKFKVFWKLPAAQSQVMTERERQQRSDVSTVDLLPLRRH